MNKKNYASLDLNYLLLEHYKKLKITEEELSVILMISHYINSGNKLVTNKLLALKMNYDSDKIDDIICSLLKKGFLEYVESKNGSLKSSLNPLNKLLYHEFELAVLGSEISKDKEIKEKIVSLYKTFEKEFGRSLAPVETQKIDEWVTRENHSIDDIEFALKEAKINNALNIKYIDKILFNKKKRDDIKKEGYSFRTNDGAINDDVDDVIEILKTKWTE